MQPNEQTIIAHGVTRFKGKEFIYTWDIQNFNSCVINTAAMKLESPVFYTHVGENIGWNLEMQSSDTNNKYLSIKLYTINDVISYKRTAYLTISVVNCKGKEIVTVQSSFVPKIGDLNARTFSEFIEKDFVDDDGNGLLIKNVLTIKCKIFFFDEFIKESRSTSFQRSTSCYCNLRTLFETKKLSDFVLIVGAQKFETHKCILAARSKIFSAMFEHDMKEKNNNTVNIDDIEPQVIEEMLKYIYCGKTEEFQDVSNLLIAADKYEIDDLKSICEDQLIDALNAENVGKTLILADRYRADILKKHVIQYIVKNAKEIDFDLFKADVDAYSPLLSDMLRGLI